MLDVAGSAQSDSRNKPNMIAELLLNGRAVPLGETSPNVTLLEFLRSKGLLGAKEGCAEGDCGACSVVIADRDTQGRGTYRAINCCLVPVSLLAGREILTAEGLADGQNLHPVQEQMVACHGSQCGYCTPGFVMSLFEGFYRDDLRSPDQLDDQLCGNLCRCTGYRSIRFAARSAFAHRDQGNGQDRFKHRLATPVTPPAPLAFATGKEQFHRPANLARVLELLQRIPEARLVAGATELGLEITKRYRRFPILVSLEACAELKRISRGTAEWRVGAAATLTDIEEQLGPEFPALKEMLRVFGSRQIRNRATMGGNIVTASPIGDSAPLLLALDATVVLVSLDANKILAERSLPITEFFVAYRKTALNPGELLKEIIVPRAVEKSAGKTFCRWYKVSRRREMDISTVAGCFHVGLDARDIVTAARLAYGGVAPTPVRARKAEAALLGQPWSAEVLNTVLPILLKEFDPISDVRGSKDFRNEIVASLFEKFFHEAHAETQRDDGNGDGSTFKTQNKPALAIPHESARHHVTGQAMYADDLACKRPMLEVWPVCSPHARARVIGCDTSTAKSMPGVRAVLTAADVPGENDVGTKHDEPLFPSSEVLYHGQIVALVVGDSAELCREAARAVKIDYEPSQPVLTIPQAIGASSFHNEPNFIRRGDADQALEGAPHTLKDEFALGGQEHFYLETHAAWAERGEGGSVFVCSSTQHPSEVQLVVSHMLNTPINQVVVQTPRMGGGFGGKETQAALPAALAALAAWRTGQPVRVRFNRDQDMAISGHRHPFLARFKVGFDDSGKILAAKISLISDGGWSLDLSQAVTDRALFHLDNAYYIPAVEFSGQVAKTNLSSNTAFRGFGGPQGMLVIEEIMDRIARHVALPPEQVRERNLYRGQGETNTTHYGQDIGDNRIETIWSELKRSSAFTARRETILEWNRKNPHHKRGMAITPVKFGISFTVTHLNQAGALVLLYQDGTVQVNHGGTEMGQGVHTNIAMIAARELGLSLGDVRIMPTSTDKVPNTSATAASCGTDLNGAAVKNACETLRLRLVPVASELLREKCGSRERPNQVVFQEGFVFDRNHPEKKLSIGEIARVAYLQRVSLSAQGFYCTPGLHWDRATGRGKPFLYYACGAAVCEVEVDGFTGMHRLLRVDILHDAGESINEGVNRGQVEGGFIQGMGWLTTEELKWDSEGRLLTHSPDTYKIPAIGDTPPVFNVSFLKNASQNDVVYGSKAVGEPPLMLAISVREALRDAIACFGQTPSSVPLASPATCEAIFKAIQLVRVSPGTTSNFAAETVRVS